MGDFYAFDKNRKEDDDGASDTRGPLVDSESTKQRVFGEINSYDNRINENRPHLTEETNDRRPQRDASFISEGPSTKSHASLREYDPEELIIRFNLQDVAKIVSVQGNSKELIAAFQQYQPRSMHINVEELKKSKYAKIKRYKDALYFGDMINDQRHGKGVLIYKSLHFYEGDWENDIKHGKGFELTAAGSRYDGQYFNGRPEGFGTFLWPNGEIYEGEWKGGLKHGSGMWKGIKGETYMGEWRFGKQEGNGVFVWRNGDRYEGEFKAYLKHGHGTEKFGNGDYYVGNYRNGKPHGYGEYYWVNGSQYKGFFKNGLRHGKGIWKSGAVSADEYDGEWANDKRCGYGVFKWMSGNYYEGEFFDDVRQGSGTMYWTDGSHYKGNWEKGIQHGEGELYIPGKEPKIGLFQNNVFIGSVAEEDDFPVNEDWPLMKPGLKSPMRHISPMHINTETESMRSFPKHRTFDSNQSTSDLKPGSNNSRVRLPSINQHKARSHNQIVSPPLDTSMNNHSALDISYEKNKTKNRDNSFVSEPDAARSKKIVRGRSVKIRPQDYKVSPRLYNEEVSPKKPANCLLSQKEWVRWTNIKHKIQGLDLKKYRDLSRPEVCNRIKKLIDPPIWYPTNNMRIEKGKSEIGSTLIVLHGE